MKLWLEAKHLEAAAKIFVKDLSPLYFGSEAILTSLSKSVLIKSAKQGESVAPELVTHPRRNYVDAILQEIEMLFIMSPESQGGFARAAMLFRRVLEVLDGKADLQQQWNLDAFKALVEQINEVFKELPSQEHIYQVLEQS